MHEVRCMTIANEDNILKLLYFYNSWWRTGEVNKNFNKPKKRFAFYEARNNLFLLDIK
jgi:hypothetical protein